MGEGAQAHPAPGDPPRDRQSARHRALPGRVLQPRQVDEGRGEKGDQRSGIGNFEQLVELGKSNSQFDANDPHIVQVVDWLWQYAFEQRASDIHIEPRRDVGIVRFRIDGVLHQVYQIPAAVLTAMTSRIKILGAHGRGGEAPAAGRPHQDAHADGEEIELRLSTLPTAFGEKLVMRIFDPEVLVQRFQRARLLGGRQGALEGDDRGAERHRAGHRADRLGQDHHAVLDAQAARHAGSQRLHHRGPDRDGGAAFNQMQVKHGIDLGFADGVRALMRQDPDIIMVGEIRDLETAEMAVQAALTGHLVLSTLHTNDAPSAMTRLLELGVPPYLLNATLNGVMAQRLVRMLCPHCKQKVARCRAEDLQPGKSWSRRGRRTARRRFTSRSAAWNAA